MRINISKSLDSEMIKNKMIAGVNLYGRSAALKLEGIAKTDAPWIDRTSNARNSIQGKFKFTGDKAIIELSGNTNYFVYLELCHEKKNSILVPTIHKHCSEIVAGYKEIFK